MAKPRLPAVGLGALLFLLSLGACGTDEETGPAGVAPSVEVPAPTAIQEGWPVPVAGSRAQLRIRLALEEEASLLGLTVYEAQLDAWVILRATPTEDGGLRVSRAQGMTAGFIDGKERREERQRKPYGGDPRMLNAAFGDGGPRGSVVSLVRGADGRFGERGETSWTLLGVPPAPDAEPTPGVAWEAETPLPLHPAAKALARFEIEAVEDDRIRLRVKWPAVVMTDEWSFSASDLSVEISRRDGLALSGAFDVSLKATNPDDPDAGVELPLHGTLERLDWTTPPAASPGFETALADLTSNDAVTRARGAKRLGETWPDGGRAATILVAALDDDDKQVRTAAAASLRRLVELGVPAIAGFLGDILDPERVSYEAAISTMIALGAKVTPKDVAGAGSASPPAGAVGMIAVPGSIASEDTIEQAVWLLEGAAAAPALLGPGGYDTRTRELAAACAAVLGTALLPPTSDRPLPDGILGLLDAPLEGTRVAAAALLCRLGIASPEAVTALRSLLDDENRMVARNAALGLHRLGLGAEGVSEADLEAVKRGDIRVAARLARDGQGSREIALLLASYLERFSHRDALEMMHREVEEALEALGKMGAAALPAAPALKGFAKKVARGPRWAHEQALAALTHVTGSSPERSAALIGHLGSRIERPDFEPRAARQLLDALAVSAKHMDAAQRREVLSLLQGVGGKTNWLFNPEVGELFLGLGREIHGELAPELATKLARSGDLVAFMQEEVRRNYRGMASRPVMPGTERFVFAVALGAKVGRILYGRAAMFEAIGGSGSNDPQVRKVLETLRDEGDLLARYQAARALRRLDAGR